MSGHVATVVTLAAEGGEESGGTWEHLNPILNGIIAFGILALLLFIVTRFNPDR